MFLRLLSICVASSLLLLNQQPALALTPAEAAGEYVATLDAGTFEASGRFRLVIGKGGLGSVAVTIGDEPPCVVGIGWGDDGGPLLIRGGDPDMDVFITIRLIDGTYVAEGEVTDDGHIFVVEAPRVATGGGSSVGRHTFVMGTEAGLGNTGSGFVRVRENGRVTGVVSTGAARKRAFAGRLSSAGKFPLVARVGESSSLIGDLTFGSVATDGTITHHNGDTTTAVMVGGAPYDPKLPAIVNAGTLPFAHIAVGNEVNGQAMGLRRDGVFARAVVDENPMRLRVHRNSGVLTGSQGALSLRGVVLQHLNGCAGLLSNGSAFAVYAPGSPLAPFPPVGSTAGE